MSRGYKEPGGAIAPKPTRHDPPRAGRVPGVHVAVGQPEVIQRTPQDNPNVVYIQLPGSDQIVPVARSPEMTQMEWAELQSRQPPAAANRDMMNRQFADQPARVMAYDQWRPMVQDQVPAVPATQVPVRVEPVQDVANRQADPTGATTEPPKRRRVRIMRGEESEED